MFLKGLHCRSLPVNLLSFFRKVTLSVCFLSESVLPVLTHFFFICHHPVSSCSKICSYKNCVKSASVWSFSGPSFFTFGLSTELQVNFHIHSELEEKSSRKSLNMDTFRAVLDLDLVALGQIKNYC